MTQLENECRFHRRKYALSILRVINDGVLNLANDDLKNTLCKRSMMLSPSVDWVLS